MISRSLPAGCPAAAVLATIDRRFVVHAALWAAASLLAFGLVTAIILIVRRHRLADTKTLGILLSPVWTPYLLQYSYVSTAFTLRKAGFLRNLIYVTACIALAVITWQGYHVAEHVGALGMLLLAALLAPADKPGSADDRSPAVPA